LFLLLIVKVFGILETADDKDIFCESVTDVNWGYGVGIVKMCHMRETTAIDQINVNIAMRDDEMGGLYFKNNKKISFLPVRVDEAFPNLALYNALGCSVKELSRVNFVGLKKLKILHLDSNQIEKINCGTFEDLVSLDILHLCKKNHACDMENVLLPCRIIFPKLYGNWEIFHVIKKILFKIGFKNLKI
jgi:Leucine rich repeat